jgi:hypothetical protein
MFNSRDILRGKGWVSGRRNIREICLTGFSPPRVFIQGRMVNMPDTHLMVFADNGHSTPARVSQALGLRRRRCINDVVARDTQLGPGVGGAVA